MIVRPDPKYKPPLRANDNLYTNLYLLQKLVNFLVVNLKNKNIKRMIRLLNQHSGSFKNFM